MSTNDNNEDSDKSTNNAMTITNWNDIRSVSQSYLRSFVQTSVRSINGGLATLETVTTEVSKPLHTGFDTVATNTSYASKKVVEVYDQRYQYGPFIIVGSAVVVGGLMALRSKSRTAGLITSLITGGATYGAIYENPFTGTSSTDIETKSD